MKIGNTLKKNKTNLLSYAVVFVGFILMQSLSTAGMLTRSVSGYLVPICVYIVLAVSLNLVVGISGELSLGHAGFMGVGAFWRALPVSSSVFRCCVCRAITWRSLLWPLVRS